jgi:hypothetical protein
LPVEFEAGPDGFSFGAGDGGVGGVDEGGCLLLGELEDVAVAGEVGDAEVGEAGLAGAEELAGAALLEVELSEEEAVLGLGHGVEAEFGFGGDLGAGEEDAEGLGGAATDAATELMHLGEAEAFGVFDDHDGGVGNVDADFDDGGGDEDVEFAAFEAGHGDLFVVGGHAAVEKAEAEAGEGAGGEFGVHFGGGAEFGAGGFLAGFWGGLGRAFSPLLCGAGQPSPAGWAVMGRAFGAGGGAGFWI